PLVRLVPEGPSLAPLVHQVSILVPFCRFYRFLARRHRRAALFPYTTLFRSFPVACCIGGVRADHYPLSVFHCNDPAALRAVVLVDLITARPHSTHVNESYVAYTLINQSDILVPVCRIYRNPAGLHRLAHVVY